MSFYFLFVWFKGTIDTYHNATSNLAFAWPLSAFTIILIILVFLFLACSLADYKCCPWMCLVLPLIINPVCPKSAFNKTLCKLIYILCLSPLLQKTTCFHVITQCVPYTFPQKYYRSPVICK